MEKDRTRNRALTTDKSEVADRKVFSRPLMLVSSRRPLSPSMSRDSASTRLSRINLLSLPLDNDFKLVFQHCDELSKHFKFIIGRNRW